MKKFYIWGLILCCASIVFADNTKELVVTSPNGKQTVKLPVGGINFKRRFMFKKLCISLIFSNLVVTKLINTNHLMHNLYTKFVKILEICKQFSHNIVNDKGNIPRRGPVSQFSDLEVVALSLAAESESVDSEKWLFDYKLQKYKDKMPNLISRRQFNDRRKKTSGLCETIRKEIAKVMDGGEDFFFVDSKPVEICRVALSTR